MFPLGFRWEETASIKELLKTLPLGNRRRFLFCPSALFSLWLRPGGLSYCYHTHPSCPETRVFKCSLTSPPPPPVCVGAPSGCGLPGEVTDEAELLLPLANFL